MHSRPYSVSRTHAQPDLHRKCRLQDSCNSARCAQHAHAHTTRAELCLNCKIARAVLSMRMHTPPACLNCKMLVCYFGLSNGGLGAILCMHSPRQMRAVWSSRLLRLLAKQQLAAAHAYVCMRWQYSAGNTTLEWKYRIDCTVSCCLEYNNSSRFTFTVCPRNCPATAPQPIRINPGSMTAMNTFAKQRGPKNNKNHSPACLHVCWQRLKNTKKHQKTTWAAKTNLKKLEEDMFCSDAKTP